MVGSGAVSILRNVIVLRFENIMVISPIGGDVLIFGPVGGDAISGEVKEIIRSCFRLRAIVPPLPNFPPRICGDGGLVQRTPCQQSLT